MSNEEYKLNRIKSAIQLCKEWAKDALEDSVKNKDNLRDFSEWSRGKAYAFDFIADWLLEIIK